MGKSKNKDQRTTSYALGAMSKEQRVQFYQQKGFELQEAFNQFYSVANHTRKFSALTAQRLSQINKELQSWEEKYQQEFQKRPSRQSVEEHIKHLQHRCTMGLSTHTKIYVILCDDAKRQRFDGQGKQLLQDEIDNFSLQKIRLLPVMNSIIEKLEELEKLQQEIEQLESKAPTQHVRKPQISIKDLLLSSKEMIFSRSSRKSGMSKLNLSAHADVDDVSEDQASLQR